MKLRNLHYACYCKEILTPYGLPAITFVSGQCLRYIAA